MNGVKNNTMQLIMFAVYRMMKFVNFCSFLNDLDHLEVGKVYLCRDSNPGPLD